ncbi:MAG: DUF4166 domain-containing protein [Pseudomonadota bacterium]
MGKQPLFQRFLGSSWQALPAAVRAVHSIEGQLRLEGKARVDRGTSLLSHIISAVIGFPKSGSDIPVTVIITQTPKGETWVRDFGGQTFRSHLSLKEGPPLKVFERFGLLRAELGLREDNKALLFPVKRAWLLGIALPHWLLPRSDTRETAQNGLFHFDVAISLPLAGQIVRYRGWLKPQA